MDYIDHKAIGGSITRLDADNRDFWWGLDFQSGNPLRIFKVFPNDFQTRVLKIYKDF